MWGTNNSVLKQELRLNPAYMEILEGILSPGVILAQEQVNCHRIQRDKHWAIVATLPNGDKNYFHRCDWHWRVSPDPAVSMQLFKFQASEPDEMMRQISSLLTWTFVSSQWSTRFPGLTQKYEMIPPQYVSTIFELALRNAFELFTALPYFEARHLFTEYAPGADLSVPRIQVSGQRLKWAISNGATKGEVVGFWWGVVVDQILCVAEMFLFEMVVTLELRKAKAAENVRTLGESLRGSVEEDVSKLLPTFDVFRDREKGNGGINDDLPIEAFSRISSWYLDQFRNGGRPYFEALIGRRKSINGPIRELLNRGNI